MAWGVSGILKRRKSRLTDVRASRVDLVKNPANARRVTFTKGQLTGDEADDELIKRVLRAAGVTTKLEKEQSTMASPNPIPLIKAFTNELDGRGEDQRASIEKSATGNLTMEGLFAPKFNMLVRELRKADRSLSAADAERQLAKDGSVGGRLHGLAFGSFSDFDSDEHLERIMKADPNQLDRLALLIMKEGI